MQITMSRIEMGRKKSKSSFYLLRYMRNRCNRKQIRVGIGELVITGVHHSCLKKPVAYDWNHIPVQVVKKVEKEKMLVSGR